MGSSSSKAARTASAAARRYPTVSSIPTTPSTAGPPSSATASNSLPPHTPSNPSGQPPTTSRKDAHIELDGRDPDFGARLGQLGPVQPVPATSRNPSISNLSPNVSPSTQPSPGRDGVILTAPTNPALLVVQARARMAKLSEQESESLGRATFAGRTLLGATEIARALAMREAGAGDEEVEKTLRLKQGTMQILGGGGKSVFRNL